MGLAAVNFVAVVRLLAAVGKFWPWMVRCRNWSAVVTSNALLNAAFGQIVSPKWAGRWRFAASQTSAAANLCWWPRPIMRIALSNSSWMRRQLTWKIGLNDTQGFQESARMQSARLQHTRRRQAIFRFCAFGAHVSYTPNRKNERKPPRGVACVISRIFEAVRLGITAKCGLTQSIAERTQPFDTRLAHLPASHTLAVPRP